MEYQAATIAKGYVFPEGPRWHDGALWFSDILDGRICAIDPRDGTEKAVVEVAGEPSGLGWLPGGDLLFVSRLDRCVYRVGSTGVTRHATLDGVHRAFSNDMVTDREGRCYVGSVGFDYEAGEEPMPSALALVHPDGRVEAAATEMLCPNGAVITADGRTLIVGETVGARLTAFDIGEHGRLSGRRLFADLKDNSPDGICLDAEGHVWVASPYGGGVLRVAEGGEVLDRVVIRDGVAFACALGGAAGRTLLVCVGTTHHSDEAKQSRTGRIDAVEVSVPA